jgi:hypothetical protein
MTTQDTSVHYYETEKPTCTSFYGGSHTGWHLGKKWHRVDGPAVEFASGSKSWYINGLRHREDGPAVERYDGSKKWYLNGKEMTEREHADATRS